MLVREVTGWGRTDVHGQGVRGFANASPHPSLANLWLAITPFLAYGASFFLAQSWLPVESRAMVYEHDEVSKSPLGRLGETTRT